MVGRFLFYWPHIGRHMVKVCIVGASGKLGKYMVQHALDRHYEVVGVCREQSVGKLDEFKDRITIMPGDTNDREVIQLRKAELTLADKKRQLDRSSESQAPSVRTRRLESSGSRRTP